MGVSVNDAVARQLTFDPNPVHFLKAVIVHVR